MDRGFARPAKRRARAEAAAWIVRLHGPQRSAQLEAGFRRWLASDSENARQFERVTEVWDTAAAAPTGGLARVAQWNRSAPGWVRAAVILLACGLVAAGACFVWLMPTYSTGFGEQRLVRLEDGSRISLNSETRVRVGLRSSGRRVQLERGEVFFEVAHDPRRPFTVVAGDHRVTALGTAFVVRYESERTAVTLVEGRVAVTTARSGPSRANLDADEAQRAPLAAAEPGVDVSTPDRQEIILAAGDRLTLAQGQPLHVDAPRLEAVTAWRRGELILERTTLADAVAEMNRYDRTALVIDGAQVAALRISGIYHTGDNQGFAETIAKLYGLEIAKQPAAIHLRATQATP